MNDGRFTYQLSPVVAIEHFGERSLALHCVDLRLIELNATARELFSRLDGRNSVEQVARSIASDYDWPPETVLQDVRAVIDRMVELGMLEPVELLPKEKN